MFTFQNSTRSWLALTAHAFGLCLVLGWWLARGQLVPVVQLQEVPPPALPCVSYSPFHRGDINPFNFKASVTAAQIESDLRLLRTRTNCIRTYGLTQGQDAVVAVAERLGMRVNLGVWLSRDTAQNQIQLTRGLELAHQYKATVERLIVGNEVLLRRELSPKELAGWLDQARKSSPVPVTYADVWEFWLRHSELSAHVDVVTIHVLPYWEDKPVAIKDAVTHVINVAQTVQEHFAGKPVWIGETGWPAAGRQRDGAVPGVVEQSQFLRELLLRVSSTTAARPTSVTLDYNFIEAFDQPWKRSFEGAMGGYWGIFDTDGKPHFEMIGGVVEDAAWWRGLLGAGIGLLVGIAASVAAGSALVVRGFASLSLRERTVYCLTFATLGAVLPVQWLMIQQWDRSNFEQATSAILATIGAVVACIYSCFYIRSSDTFLTLKNQRKFDWISKKLLFVLLFCAATAALVLLLDSRYRPFPWWWFLAPAVSLLSLRISGHLPVHVLQNKNQVLCAVIAVCAFAVAIIEGMYNAQAITYCVLLLVIAATCGWPSRTKTSNANNTAGAHNSVV